LLHKGAFVGGLQLQLSLILVFFKPLGEVGTGSAQGFAQGPWVLGRGIRGSGLGMRHGYGWRYALIKQTAKGSFLSLRPVSVGELFRHTFLRATDKIVQQVNGGSEAVEPKPESRGIPLGIGRYWGG
jgi:hypothetical protein